MQHAVMRRLFRLALTGIAAVFFGLAIFTAETVADAVGYTDWIRSLVRDGWSAMIDAGYASWIQAGALFFGGAALALWVDFLIRKGDGSSRTRRRPDS